ncbi:MAG: HU family DNA-binding protein, partial [Rikenellaceae bacterium]
MASQSGLSKTDSKKALEAFVEVTTNALKTNDKIALVGFGTFSVSQKKERTGHNPSTKAVITIPAKKVAKFKAGATLLEDIK